MMTDNRAVRCPDALNVCSCVRLASQLSRQADVLAVSALRPAEVRANGQRVSELLVCPRCGWGYQLVMRDGQ